MVTATVVALVTALLMVQGVVGEATSNPLRASHLTLDQYSPSPPYHHGLFGFYGRRSNDDGSSDENDYQQQQQQQQHKLQQQGLQQRQYLLNRKFEDDSIIYRSIDDRHNRHGSIVSISVNDYPIRMKAYDKDSTGATISRDPSGMNVPQYDKERSTNLAGRKEFDENKGNNDYVAPPSEMDEPFVADETFKDEGPGSVEIYKLDLFEEKKPLVGPTSNAKGAIVGNLLTGSLAALPTPVTTTTSGSMKTSNNKSKVPKKSFRHGWKVGKASSGSFKSTMITTTTSGRSNKDGKDLHGGSNFLDSELRSEVPTSVEAFGVGGVPELQVGCEGLEAAAGASPFSSSFSSSSSSFSSSPSSLKLKRSVENANVRIGGERKVDPPAPLNVVPISLNLDYDLSAESYEEMDELLKLKKLENEPKRNKENRGDIDATLDDFLIQDRNERLPVRGDLGNWAEPPGESIKRDNDESKVRRERSSESDAGTSGYVSSFKGPSRKLLWHEPDNESGLWGYGEDEGVVSSDELDTEREQRRRHRLEHRREEKKQPNDTVNSQIDKIREDYERSLEQQRRKQEETLRRFKEQERRKFDEDRMRMEELRKREEARRREDELRRRNFMTNDRRDFDNRRREWMERRRLEEKEEEERRRQIEENRKRNEDMLRRRLEFPAPSNWIDRARNVSREEEERNRAVQRQRLYDYERRRQMEEERRRMEERERRMEMERSRSRENATRDDMRKEEHRRRLEKWRREQEEERKLQDYVRRNQPVDVRNDWQRWKEVQEQRKAIEAIRQMNRSNRYPLASGYERRQHGPSAPTYVDRRSSLDEARRRQEEEYRRQLEEEQRRRMLEEERAREIDNRRAQSRRYEEERKRIENIRLQEERRRQQAIENQRRRSEFSARVSPNPVTSGPAFLTDRRGDAERMRERSRERQREQQRARQEQERKRQEIIRRQQHENSAKTQWDRENYRRVMTEQRRRQEETRLNALPVSASIIIRKEGSSSYPAFNSRSNFVFPDQYSRSTKMAQFPSISRKTTNGPNPCIWAVVQCCPVNANRLLNCFESLGCPGVNWDPNPCRAEIEDAARDEVMRFYNSNQGDENYK